MLRQRFSPGNDLGRGARVRQLTDGLAAYSQSITVGMTIGGQARLRRSRPQTCYFMGLFGFSVEPTEVSGHPLCNVFVTKSRQILIAFERLRALLLIHVLSEQISPNWPDLTVEIDTRFGRGGNANDQT